ncbi:MAG: M81 family metallopeptidase [Pirellula sp.]
MSPTGKLFRIGIVAILHESNTFIEYPTELRHFEQNLLVEGEAVLGAFRGSNHEVGGFIAALEDASGFEPVGVFAARAMPYGTITEACWSTLMERLTAAVDRTSAIDAWLVAPHGATVAENALDADGFWLTRLRELVGTETKIIGTLDLHANVSLKMVDACNALFAYKTNPHLDQRDRGMFAAQVLMQSLQKHIAPVSVLGQLPMSVNIERQATREPQGARLRYRVDALKERETKLIDVSFLYGFPYADVPEMGASLIVVTDGDLDLAKRISEELVEKWWSDRDAFRGQGVSIQNAIEMCLPVDEHQCIGLLDMGDNIGGGSPGDGTLIAHELLRNGILPAFVWLCDEESVAQAAAAGLGSSQVFALGGKSDSLHGPPISDKFTVRWLGPGKFTESQPRHGGYSSFDQGDTAILVNAGGLTVMIAKRRVAPVSLCQLSAFGLEPGDFRALVIKGVHAPVAAYESVCTKLIRVNTPGVTSADDSAFEYRHRRRPMFPWETAG